MRTRSAPKMAMCSMSNKNRQRGKSYEKWLASDLGGRRVGILCREDVDLPGGIYAECKERQDIPKFLTNFMEQAERNCGSHFSDEKRVALAGITPAVFIHQCSRSHDQDIVCMRYDDWKSLYRRAINGGSTSHD